MKKSITRQELRRQARRKPIPRCPVCGKRSSRHNAKAHAIAGIPIPTEA